MKGGVVATDGRDIVYLRDDNGDGRSDSRKVLATGLNVNDTHAATSQFQYGLDNWIYATVGYSGVEMDIAGRKIVRFVISMKLWRFENFTRRRSSAWI